MTKMFVTMKVMPDDAEVSIEEMETQVKETLATLDCEFKTVEKDPIGFGLVALVFRFVREEEKGADDVEEALQKLSTVGETQVLMLSRAMG